MINFRCLFAQNLFIQGLFYSTLYMRCVFLHELAGLVCQIPCCSSPSGSWFHIRPLVQASHPPCLSHLARPVDPGEGPAETHGYRPEVEGYKKITFKHTWAHISD